MDTDLAILGGGPAGLTAGMYAARARIRVALLEKGQPGGQIAVTEVVDNYPGFEEPVLGWELAQKMEAQARKFGVMVVRTVVTRVVRAEGGFQLTLDSGDSYTCRSLILATGASPVKLGIPGERELAGKGVSYCAVCDGPFYRDQEIAVVGGGDSAVQEALYLTRFASTVHLIHRRDELRAIKDIQEKAFAEPRIRIHWNRVPIAVTGNKEVESLVIRSVIDGSEEALSVSGVFFYVGLRPNSEPFRDLVHTDEWGFVLTDVQMACSAPGIYAAGDIRSKALRQISTAVGDGALAAYSAQRYLGG
jgi:thioredoxin reductase (NADPH)